MSQITDEIAKWPQGGPQHSAARLRTADAVLDELVYLKDMKDRLQQLHEMGQGADYETYNRRKPAAWNDARAYLAAKEGER